MLSSPYRSLSEERGDQTKRATQHARPLRLAFGSLSDRMLSSPYRSLSAERGDQTKRPAAVNAASSRLRLAQRPESPTGR
jgi:hypothetical protein